MRPEFDFSKGVRGNREVQRYLVQRAADEGTSLEAMVNSLLKREIEIIESVK